MFFVNFVSSNKVFCVGRISNWSAEVWQFTWNTTNFRRSEDYDRCTIFIGWTSWKTQRRLCCWSYGQPFSRRMSNTSFSHSTWKTFDRLFNWRCLAMATSWSTNFLSINDLENLFVFRMAVRHWTLEINRKKSFWIKKTRFIFVKIPSELAFFFYTSVSENADLFFSTSRNPISLDDTETQWERKTDDRNSTKIDWVDRSKKKKH